MSYRELGRTFQVRHVMAAITSNGCITVGTRAKEARAKLSSANYDYGVVLDKDGAVLGFIPQPELLDSDEPFAKEPCTRRLTLDYVMADNTALEEVIRYLAKSPFQFVVHGKEIVGLITPWDLNKHPVYSYFYLLLSQLEQSLVQAIKLQLPSEGEWKNLVSPRPLERSEARWRKARAGNRELSLLHYLNFSDYLEIVGGSAQLSTALGIGSSETWLTFTTHACSVRNDVAHPTKDLVGEHRSVDDLLGVATMSHFLMERAGALLSQGRIMEAIV